VIRNAQEEARIALRLTQIADSAIAFGRGRGRYSEDAGHGVRSHPHLWCFDLLGRWGQLVDAGCVYPGWLPSGHWECVGLELKGRNVEIYNLGGSIEVSVTFTDDEAARIRG
jgi:hypothetical protein